MAKGIAPYIEFAAPVDAGVIYSTHTVDNGPAVPGADIMRLAGGIYRLRVESGIEPAYGSAAYASSIASGSEGDYFAVVETTEPAPDREHLPVLAYAIREPLPGDKLLVTIGEIATHRRVIDDPGLYRAVGNALFSTLLDGVPGEAHLFISSKQPSTSGRATVRDLGLEYYRASQAARHPITQQPSGFYGSVATIRTRLQREA